MRVLSLSGKPSASRSGPAVSTLIRKVSGLRRYRPGRFVGRRRRRTRDPWPDAALHIPACVRGRHGASCRLLSALRPMAPSMPTPKDHEKDVGAEACAEAKVEKKARDRGMFVG